jgi:hypothetical protein
MAGLGTEVGDAYIEVHANTTAFRRELRRDARLAAQDFGKSFSGEFDKVIDRQLTPVGVRIRKALTEQGRLTGEGFADALEDEVVGMAKRLDGLLVKAITSGDFSDFVSEIGSISEATKALDKRLGELRAAQELNLGNSNRIVRSYHRWRLATESLIEMQAEAVRSNQRQAAATRDAQFAAKAFEDRVKALAKTEADAAKERDRVQTAIEKNSAASWRRQARAMESFFQGAKKGSVESTRVLAAEAEKQAKALEKVAIKSKEAQDKIDRETGTFLGRLKGSRNDFLNIIGVIAKAIENIASKAVTNTLDGIGNALGRLGARLLATGGPLSGLGANIGALGARIQGLGSGGIDGLIVQIAAMSLAFQAIVVVAGTAAAGLSLLAAAFTALTVTVGGGLLGGLTLLGPLIGGLAVGVGALALAFTDLSDAQKDAFQPLQDILDSVRAGVQEALFADLGSQIESLKGILTPLQGILVDTANATREWFNDMLAAFDPSGPLGGSLTVLEESLPRIFTGLLDLLTNLSTSLVGLFAAASPTAEKFLEHINGVVSQFSAWVNSAEGQETIKAFLTEALGVMGQLWDIAKELGTTLAILFDTGANTGDTFLQKIQQILEKFNEWLGSEEGRIALSNWFADSVVAIEKVGEVLDALIKLFDELDNPATRLSFEAVLTALAGLVVLITRVQNFFNGLITAIINGLARAQGPITNTAEFIKRVQQAFANLQTGALNAINNIAAFFRWLPGRIAADVGNLGGLLYGAGVSLINGLLNGITSAFNGVMAYIQRLASRIASAFRDALGIASPSKVFREYGMNIGEGLALGISDSVSLVDGSLNNLIDSSMLSNLNSPVSTLATQGTTATTATTNGTGSVIESGAITVVSPYADPMLVAVEVMDALAVRGK